MVRKIWKYRNEAVSGTAVDIAAEKTGIPRLLANILLNRGIAAGEFKTFLSKSKQGILNPMSMLDMDKAVDRIAAAIDAGESIAIYGDYDVDGITSTSLLYGFLRSVGANLRYYIPDRKDEGYGINIMAVNRLIKEGVKLLITVDCGITAIGEIEFAKLQGMDVIVTDHHTCKERIPTAAVAVLNPKREDDEYSFLLLQSLLDRLAEGATEWLHEKIRKEYWGYASDEDLTIPALFTVKYSGIRPAVGYPSIPDQSINFDLHNDLLQSSEIGISLTENGLMYPNASVSGFIFAHPEAKYFAIGPISDEQAKDYMKRRNKEFGLAQKFLAANLNK